ncbi:MAG: glutamate-1-semialdehyde 2,1-aminomutase [Eubacteriales bacterium]|nr:glutamate-1-semialdehyde 2,1-aminomutase [Eubacteriales bacterium]
MSKSLTSPEWFDRAQLSIPGGVNSPVRAFRSVGQSPRFIARGQGSHLWDEEGCEYIDFVGSWGPLILGHAHPVVQEAIVKAASSGWTYGAPTTGEVELAEQICRLVPSVEKVRLVSSGTEAVMTAIRLARAFTGRDLIIKMDGCYHGHSDGLLVQAGSGLLTNGLPDSAGVPEGYARLTLSCPYNDTDTLESLFQQYPDQIAAVIVEPVAANMGVVPPLPGFLAALRRLTQTNGALLVFDEVITGFRLALGGAQQVFSVQPDLTTFGKIIGGGLPMGAVGGKRAIMDQLAPLGPVYQAGTLSGNPLAVAAGRATLAILEQNPAIYLHLEQQASWLAEQIRSASARNSIPVTVNRCGSLLSLFFCPGPVNHLEQAKTSRTDRFSQFFTSMLAQGIYLPPSNFEAWFLSAQHSEEDITRTAEACATSLQELNSRGM